MARQKQPDTPWTPDQLIPDAQHEMFAQAYVVDFNATKAYRQAYNKPYKEDQQAVWTDASNLLRHSKVNPRVKYLLSLRKAAFESNQTTIKEMTVNVLRSSPLDYMAVSDTETETGGVMQSGRLLDQSIIQHPELINELEVVDGKCKIKLMDKNRALEHLLRIEKLLVDKHELSGELMVRQNIESDEAYRRRVDKLSKGEKKKKKA